MSWVKYNYLLASFPDLLATVSIAVDWYGLNIINILYANTFCLFILDVSPRNFKFQTQLYLLPFGMEVMCYLLNLGIEVLMMGFVGSSWLDP